MRLVHEVNLPVVDGFNNIPRSGTTGPGRTLGRHRVEDEMEAVLFTVNKNK